MYLHHLRFRRPQRDLDHIHKATWAAAENRCLWAMPTPTYLILMSPSDQVTPGREFAQHDVKPYDLTFDAGQRVTFSLIAHPTVAVKAEGRPRGLPVHPAYAMSHGGRLDRRWLRVGSIGGTRALGRGRMEWESAYYGDVITAGRAEQDEHRRKQ